MPRRRRTAPRTTRLALATAVLGAVAVPLLAGPAGSTAAAATTCPWMDRSKTPAVRAHELVAAMTLQQEDAELYGRGDFTHYGAANDIPAVPALCIPELVFNDAGAGIADVNALVTAFPDGITQAASWDRQMQYQLGEALGREAWHKGINVQLAPGVDIARNPLTGRDFEYAGEDPYLSGQTGVAEIEGIQSQHVVATVKHYALNDQETNRMSDSSNADERTMEEIHLPAYEAAVKAGVGSVMCSYNRINGVYACENPYLLNTVLKKQFGFTGWVMSDWGGTHSTVAAANSGLDQEQNITSGSYFNTPLVTAVQNHQVPKSRVDDMVYRLMYSLIRIGVFDDPPPTDPSALTTNVSTAQNQTVALEAAEGGAVLLKNSGGELPLHGNGKTIAVIGDPAGPTGAQNFYQGGGSSKVPISGGNPNVVTPLQGITTRATSDGDTVVYDPGTSTTTAAAVASAADEVIVVAGDGESEGVDRTSLSMNQNVCTLFGCVPSTGPTPDALIAAVAAANPNTVVVVQAGGPVAMPWLSHVKAVLDTWYPGQADGTAMAALLFGDVNPSGKLPFTFPTSMAQTEIRSAAQWPGVNNKAGIPQSTYSEKLLVGYRWYQAEHLTPLFPFGFGLSYTTFRVSGLSVKASTSGATATFSVTNTGHVAGAEVPQLYVGDPAAAGEPPLQLKGYSKLWLAPGQTKSVTLSLDQRAFSQWSTAKHAWFVTPGCYSIHVGDSSTNLPLTGHVARAGGTCATSTSSGSVARGVTGPTLADTGLVGSLPATGAALLAVALVPVVVRRRRVLAVA